MKKNIKRRLTFFILTIVFLFSNSQISAQYDTNFYHLRYNFYQGYDNQVDTNEGDAINSFKKFEYIYGPKFSPTGNMPNAARAIDDYINEFNLNGKGIENNSADWTSLGPYKNPLYPNSASGVGRLNCITFDPIYGDSIIYVDPPLEEPGNLLILDKTGLISIQITNYP